MAKGQNRMFAFNSLISAAPSIVHLAQLFFGHATGAEKKAAAIEAGKSLLTSAGEGVLAANPSFVEHYGGVIQAAYDAAAGNGTLAGVVPENAPSAAPAPAPIQ